jgi:hypothetical protein
LPEGRPAQPAKTKATSAAPAITKALVKPPPETQDSRRGPGVSHWSRSAPQTQVYRQYCCFSMNGTRPCVRFGRGYGGGGGGRALAAVFPQRPKFLISRVSANRKSRKPSASERDVLETIATKQLGRPRLGRSDALRSLPLRRERAPSPLGSSRRAC